MREIKQLSIFDALYDIDLDTKIKSLLEMSLITIKGKVVDKAKIVSVFIPYAAGAEPAVITLENDKYVRYTFTHGRLYETYESSIWFNRFPAYYWTWLDRSLAPIYY